MNIELIRGMPIDILISELKKSGYNEFSDEKHRVISIDLFITLFSYKYGALNDFSFFIAPHKYVLKNECRNKYTLSCESFGFRYCFPIYSEMDVKYE